MVRMLDLVAKLLSGVVSVAQRFWKDGDDLEP